LVIIAGPCVIESRDLCVEIADALVHTCDDLGLPLIFKASFDKANRTSIGSPRGPGMDEGLRILDELRTQFGVPVTTDVHAPEQARPVGQIVDVLQIPAFLCRQTDLLVAVAEAAAAHDAAVNIKKGQFLSPGEIAGPVEKVTGAGCDRLIVTERGTFFGYHRLVNDFIGIGDLLTSEIADGPQAAVCFDATHSAQLPGASATTGGRREHVPLLARAAVAAGVDALFLECHPDPENAQSDASTMLALESVPRLLAQIKQIAQVVR
jgi:2-dehydro-3-deoxyphosphooctonate aldolase (KDO 8-P synthase)